MQTFLVTATGMVLPTVMAKNINMQFYQNMQPFSQKIAADANVYLFGCIGTTP